MVTSPRAGVAATTCRKRPSSPFLMEFATLATYRGDTMILPAVPGASSEMHPMMIWWAFLYSLSMLTRYRPETWTELVNVDASKYAVPVEFIPEVGLDAVPDVIAHALDDAPQ
jgi:hypothetical protein